MAITKSAQRAWRKSERKRERNLKKKKKIKEIIKKFKKLVSQKKIEEAKGILSEVYKVLDKAAKTGLMKKNTAARKKSRLSRLLKL